MIPLPKRPWLAASEVIGLNLGIWAFDRYILEGDYAYISMSSVKRNLRKGFYWDNDNFQTNLFNHPYHGSIYFNSARSNGMNYWQSGIYSLGGSLMWELFMECELPSTNDLIATSIGGMALGEFFYRVSDIPLDNRATGWNRVGREVLGTILSPGRGITRIVTGEAWKKSGRSGKQFPSPDVRFSWSTGVKTIELHHLTDDLIDEGVGLCMDFRMVYGDFHKKTETSPYDYFAFYGSFNIQKNQPFIGQLSILGRLWGKNIYDSPKRELYLGIYQHFDYYNSDTLANVNDMSQTETPYEVGTPASAGAGLSFWGHNEKKTFNYWAQLHVNAIILGSSLSDYYRGNERNYNWGSGYSAKLNLGVTYKDKLTCEINFENYHIFTWKGYDPDLDLSNVDFDTLNAQGDNSNALYDVGVFRLSYKLLKNLDISAHQYTFFRKTHYVYLEDVSSSTTETRLMLTHRF